MSERDALEELRLYVDRPFHRHGFGPSTEEMQRWLAAWEKERADSAAWDALWPEVVAAGPEYAKALAALRAAVERIEAYCRGEAAKFDPEADDGIQGAYAECADLLRAAREGGK